MAPLLLIVVILGIVSSAILLILRVKRRRRLDHEAATEAIRLQDERDNADIRDRMRQQEADAVQRTHHDSDLAKSKGFGVGKIISRLRPKKKK
jgi:hypothetical protein